MRRAPDAVSVLWICERISRKLYFGPRPAEREHCGDRAESQDSLEAVPQHKERKTRYEIQLVTEIGFQMKVGTNHIQDGA